jgi:hypothetical protein
MQSVPITTNVVISNPTNDNVYSIQLYVIKYVSDLQQVGLLLNPMGKLKFRTLMLITSKWIMIET